MVIFVVIYMVYLRVLSSIDGTRVLFEVHMLLFSHMDTHVFQCFVFVRINVYKYMHNKVVYNL